MEVLNATGEHFNDNMNSENISYNTDSKFLEFLMYAFH